MLYPPAPNLQSQGTNARIDYSIVIHTLFVTNLTRNAMQAKQMNTPEALGAILSQEVGEGSDLLL